VTREAEPVKWYVELAATAVRGLQGIAPGVAGHLVAFIFGWLRADPGEDAYRAVKHCGQVTSPLASRCQPRSRR
jgi:hypothetical protein